MSSEVSTTTTTATTKLATAAAEGRSRPLLHLKELAVGPPNKKITFTCVHASDNFLVCGASNGSVSLFATSAASAAPNGGTVTGSGIGGNGSGGSGSSVSGRALAPSKYHLVKLIAPPPHSDRIAVACLSICPLQRRLVVGTMRGVVYGLLLTDYHKLGDKVEFTHDFHAGAPVTCFLWDKLGTKLYSACNGGLVALTTLRAGMSAFFGRTDTELLLKEETGIVQLDMTKYGRADVLMVSSQLRVLLLNLSSTDGSAVQIGTKPRQGTYGACFFTAAADETEIAKQRNVKVFSSRPGRRVWVADPQTGTVCATLKFQLTKKPTTFLDNAGSQVDEAVQSRDLTINKLALFHFLPLPVSGGSGSTKPIDRSLLVSWNVGSSVLFFLDPEAVEIVEWHLDLGVIHDLTVLNESVLVILHGEGPKVSIVQSCSAKQFLDLYAGDDVRKAVEMAVTYQMNDAAVLDALRKKWQQLQQESGSAEHGDSLTASLEELVLRAKEREASVRGEADDTESAAPAATPLQVIFKHRPQQQRPPDAPTQVEDSTPDLFAGRETPTPTPRAAAATTDYYDAQSPALSYSRSIFAPDGSTLEARLIDIPELDGKLPVVRDDIRDAWMGEIQEAVRQYETAIAAEEASRNLLPTIRGTLNHTGAAAMAITTYIPGATMISNLVDTAASTTTNYVGAIGIFGDLPGTDDSDIILDPIPMPKTNLQQRRQRPYDVIGNECAVLRIAMSTPTGPDDPSQLLDTEVLLEAISMDIWDSHIKYISNLPIAEQLQLPSPPVEVEAQIPTTSKASSTPRGPPPRPKPPLNHRNTDLSDRMSSLESTPTTPNAHLRKSRSVDDLKIDLSSVSMEDERLAPPITLSPTAPQASLDRPSFPPLARRSSLSPDSRGRVNPRILQKHIGGGPSCDLQRKCMVGGQLATTPELENLLKREIVELTSELQAAASTAATTTHLTRRLWPAAGITRVCAVLTNMYLFYGDLDLAQATIQSWLSCFDPKAKPEDIVLQQHKKNPSSPSRAGKTGPPKPAGFARGEALIDGDGLPLTRSDWTLVRVLVSIYFAIRTAGAALKVYEATEDDLDPNGTTRPYGYEMGLILHVEGAPPRGEDTMPLETWAAPEAEAFVSKYGIYLNTELAAEVCNLRRLGGALNAVLDQVVSSSNMSSTCDDVVNWIAEKQFPKALETLRDMNSLCLILHTLDLLLKKCPDDAIEVCVSRYPSLSPWNVERSLFGVHIGAASGLSFEELLTPMNLPQTATYFRYLMRLLEMHPDIIGVEHPELVDRCLQLSFSGSKVTAEWWKKRKPEKRESDEFDRWLDGILCKPETYRYQHASAWDLCDQHHHLAGKIALLSQSFRATQDANTAARIKVELRNVLQMILDRKQLRYLGVIFSLLSRYNNQENLLQEVLGYIEKHAAKGDDELITTVIHALLNAMGTKSGMDVLKRYPLLFSACPLSLYQAIVEAHALSLRQGKELVRMLESVDTHVWSAFKEASTSSSNRDGTSGVSLPPQVQAVFDLERGAIKTALDEKKFEKWEQKVEQYDAELRQCSSLIDIEQSALSKNSQRIPIDHAHTAPIGPTFEFRNRDWGGEIQLHDMTCAMCDLAVVIIAEDNCNLEVTLLPCGHAYHASCLEDSACPTCFASNFDSLLTGW